VRSRLPLLYFGTAHVSLALAAFLVGWAPRAVAGFFYHSWMVAIVHMVTLGWITMSILGAIYLVGPLALRMPLRIRWSDYAAYGFAVVGIIGMVAHFWIHEFGGMAWSAATVTCGILFVCARILANLRRSTMPAAVKLHLVFACANLALAASAGILLGFDKVYHFLPGFVLSNVFAHAHLAAVGWAAMMVVGVGYRMLPMTLPARMPAGRTIYASALLLETGVLGLFVTLIFRSAFAPLFGVTIVLGLAAFGAHVVWMVRSPALAPPDVPPIAFGSLHAVGAGVSLILASAIGLTLLIVPASERTMRAAIAYGVFGLVGFLAQMVVAMETHLLPLFGWFLDGGPQSAGVYTVASPRARRNPTRQAIVLSGWSFGVPALAMGFFLDGTALVAAGAWALFVAVAVGAIDSAVALRHNRGSNRPRATAA
jgi:hypothetical protein